MGKDTIEISERLHGWGDIAEELHSYASDILFDVRKELKNGSHSNTAG